MIAGTATLAKCQSERYVGASDEDLDRARILVAEDDTRAETITDAQGAWRERLGRITFRAWRRGFREADLVLGPFIEREGRDLSDGGLDQFETLLNEDDHDIYAWIIGTTPTPDLYETPLMERLRRFMRAHVATAVAEGIG